MPGLDSGYKPPQVVFSSRSRKQRISLTDILYSVSTVASSIYYSVAMGFEADEPLLLKKQLRDSEAARQAMEEDMEVHDEWPTLGINSPG